MKVLLFLFPLSLLAMERRPDTIINIHHAHEEHSDKSHTALEYESLKLELCQEAISLYLKEDDERITRKIMPYLSSFLQEAVNSENNDIKTGVRELIRNYKSRRNSVSDYAHMQYSSDSDSSLSIHIETLIRESIAKAFEANSLQEAFLRAQKREILDELKGSKRKTYYALAANVVTALIVGGVTAAATLLAKH